MKKHWKLVVAITVVLLALLVYFAASAYRSLKATQTSQSGTVPQQAPTRRADPGTSQPSPGLGAFVDQGAAPGFGDSVRASVPRLANLGVEAAAEYRRRARLPKSTAPIEDGSDPVQRERTASPATSLGPGGAEPGLTAFPATVSFEAPDPVVVHAYLSQSERRVPADILTAKFIHERLGEVGSLEMNDAGLDGDEAAGDLVYSTAFSPPPDRAADFSGTYVVSVRGLTRGGEERAVSTGFLYNAPDAKPTGRFRDRLVDGSLVLECEIQVFKEGRFHVEGSLFTVTGEGVAWAQNAARFPPGRVWFPLTFYGLAIREKGLDGPYVLRSLALSTVTGMPNQKNRVLTDAYQTRAYRHTDFTNQPFNDPDLLEAAERLEQAGRGRNP